MPDDALTLLLPAEDNLQASGPDRPHSMAMLQDASFSEPANPANLANPKGISGKEMTFEDEMVGGKWVHDVNSTIDASFTKGVSSLSLARTPHHITLRGSSAFRGSSTPDRVAKPDPSRYVILHTRTHTHIRTHTPTHPHTHATHTHAHAAPPPPPSRPRQTHTHTHRERTTTPKSLLGCAPSSKNRDATDSQGASGSVVDELVIHGLNARIDAMQTRLAYQMKQAYLAREKTRSAVKMRRGEGGGEGGWRDEGEKRDGSW